MKHLVASNDMDMDRGGEGEMEGKDMNTALGIQLKI